MPKVKALNKLQNQPAKEEKPKEHVKCEQKKAELKENRTTPLSHITDAKQNLEHSEKSQGQQNRLKKVFYKLSLIQLQYNLRFSTLFHSLELYQISSKALLTKREEIPENYLILACLYLSAKYEEIYPPKLKHFASYFKNSFLSIKSYRNYEKRVLDILQGDLNIKTIKTIIESKLQGCQRIKYFQAYYLIEHCFFNDDISNAFTSEEICEAVQMLIKPCKMTQQNTKANIQKCAKMILLSKSQQSVSSDFLFRKYSKQAYMNVSKQHISHEQ